MCLSPKWANVEVKNLSKNSSTAPTITRFISKSCQANLINELPLQLCPSWPRSPGKGRKQAYTYVHITKVFEDEAKKNLSSASAVILFSQEIFGYFLKIDEEDRRFRPNLLFLSKNF